MKCIYLKIKRFYQIFFCISGIYIKFGILWKRRWASEYISFWNYRLHKAGLLKRPKSPVSQKLWTVNMLKDSKDYLSLHSSIFVIFFYPSEKKSAPRTYWHPMKIILSQKKRVFNATNLNSIIWKSKNMFSILFCISEIYVKFRTLCKKRWASEIICFWNYRLQKAELLKYPKSHVSKHLWIVKMLKGPKDCLNLHGSILFIFFDHSQTKSVPRTLF